MTIVDIVGKVPSINGGWKQEILTDWSLLMPPSWDKDDIVQHRDEHGVFYSYKSLIDDNSEEPSKYGNINWIFWNTDKNIPSAFPYPWDYHKLFDYYSDTNIAIGSNDNYAYVKWENKLYDFIGADGCENIDTVLVEITDENDDLLWSKTINMIENPIIDWYDWTYSQPSVKHKKAFMLFIPIYPNSSIKLTFFGEVEVAKVGSVVIGNREPMECTLTDVKLTSKSSKQLKRDETTGAMIYDDRKNGGYKEVTANVYISDYTKTDQILNTLEELKQVPTVFIADDRDDEELRKTNYTILGVIDEYQNTLKSNLSDYTITIKSM